MPGARELCARQGYLGVSPLAGQVQGRCQLCVLGAGAGAVAQQQRCQLAVPVQGSHVQGGETILVGNIHPQPVGTDLGKLLLRKTQNKSIIMLCFNQ